MKNCRKRSESAGLRTPPNVGSSSFVRCKMSSSFLTETGFALFGNNKVLVGMNQDIKVTRSNDTYFPLMNLSPHEFTMLVGSAQDSLFLETLDLEKRLKKLEKAFCVFSLLTAAGSTNSCNVPLNAVTWYCKVLFSSETGFTAHFNVASVGSQTYPSSTLEVDVAPLTLCLKWKIMSLKYSNSGKISIMAPF